MVLNELKEEKFKTNIIDLMKIGSIFRTKEYKIGSFYKENFNEVLKIYGQHIVDFYSYDNGIIVLEFED